MSRSILRWQRRLLLALCVTYPSAVLGQAAPPEATASPEELEKRKEEAKLRFQRGLELVQNESWDAALAEFLASRKLFPTRVALKNAALSLRQLKRYVEALAMYSELLASFGSTIPPDERKTIDDAITQLRQAVGEVVVESDQPGSTVVIDGQQQGTTPLQPIGVNAGTHTVRISKEGYEAYEAQVLVAGGQREVVKGKLKALSTIGRLVVSESAGKKLDVVVDGAVVGQTPRWEGVLAVGPHTVFLRGEGNVGTAPSQARVKENQATTLALSAVELDSEIRIEPVPANASVFVDGVQLGNGVWEGRLQSGQHQIEVAAEGFVPYRRMTTLTKGKRELAKVTLERDLSNPMWKAGFVPHLYVEAFGGAALAPISGFGGDPDQGCSDGQCSAGGMPLGFAAGARGGYEFLRGFGVELGLGFLYLADKKTRELSAEGERNAFSSSDYVDETRFAAPFVQVSAAYRMLDKTPLTFRLGGGVARAKATFKNGGTFSGAVPHVCDDLPDGIAELCDPEETSTISERVEIAEKSEYMIVPFAAPEVRFGYRLSKKIFVDLGVAMFFMLPPEHFRTGKESGNFGISQGDGQRRKALRTSATFETEPLEQDAGVLNLPREKSFGVVMALVPTVSAHFDF